MTAVARLVQRTRDTDGGLVGRVQRYTLVFLMVVLFASTRSIDSDDDDADAARTIAVHDEVAAGALLDRGDADRIELLEVDDVPAAVADGVADAGLVFDGRTARVVEVEDEESSRNAAQRVRLLLDEQDDRPSLTAFVVREVDDAGRDQRLALASALVLALGIGMQSVAGEGTKHLVATANAGTLESLVVLPIRRRALAAGIALGTFRDVVMDLALIGVVIGALALSPLPGLGLDLSASGDLATALALGTVGMAPLVASFGAVLAVLRQGGIGGALAGSLQVPLIGGAFLVSAQVRDVSSPLRYVPGTSSLRAAGEALVGRLEVGGVAWALGTTLAASAVLIAVAAWLLDRDAVATRA